jgi:pyruvate kinase
LSAWDVRPDGGDRRTKIVATIGPATSTAGALRALVQAGVNVARLNFSHGTPEGHLETILRLRRLAGALEVPIAILQDLTGPKVRIGEFAAGTVELHPGAPFTLTTRAILGSPEAVSVSYARLPKAVAPERGRQLLVVRPRGVEQHGQAEQPRGGRAERLDGARKAIVATSRPGRSEA